MTMRVTVLAGGYSAKLLNLARLPGIVIAVNDSALYAPRVDIVVSMDRLWTENRFAAVELLERPLWFRRSTLKNVPWQRCQDVRPFECDHTATTLSDEPGTLNGTHSGFCALNLAYQMRPKQLFLVGFDMQRGPHGERHWYPDYPWNAKATGTGRLHEWAGQFAVASAQLVAAGVETFLCGALTKVPGMHPMDRRTLEHVP